MKANHCDTFHHVTNLFPAVNYWTILSKYLVIEDQSKLVFKRFCKNQLSQFLSKFTKFAKTILNKPLITAFMICTTKPSQLATD